MAKISKRSVQRNNITGHSHEFLLRGDRPLVPRTAVISALLLIHVNLFHKDG